MCDKASLPPMLRGGAANLAVDVGRKARANIMPTETDALRALWTSVMRLRELGMSGNTLALHLAAVQDSTALDFEEAKRA